MRAYNFEGSGTGSNLTKLYQGMLVRSRGNNVDTIIKIPIEIIS